MADSGTTKKSPDGLSILDTIADEYKRREEETSELASSQIRLVAALLIGGLILLLILPRVIQEVEFLGRSESVPSEIIANAEISLSLLSTNYTEMKAEVEGISDRLSKLGLEREGIQVAIDELKEQVRAVISPSLSIWKNTPPDQLGKDYQVTASRKLSEEEIAIFGFTGEQFNPNAFIGLSSNGADWTLIQLERDLRRSEGSVFDAARTRGTGELFVGGHLGTFQSPDVFFVQGKSRMESTEGEVTTRDLTTDGIILSRPFDDGTQSYGEPNRRFLEDMWAAGDTDEMLWEDIAPSNKFAVKGTLFGLLTLDDDQILLTGRSGLLLEAPKALVAFHDPTTSMTSIVEPEKINLGVGGSLYAPVALSSGRIVVGGFEQPTPGEFSTIVAIYDPSSRTWTAAKPDEDGVRIQGAILGLYEQEAGGVVAYGYDGEPRDSEILILTTKDFERWDRIKFSFSDGPLKGNISGVHQSADGWLFSGFNESSRRLFLLEASTDFKRWRYIELLMNGRAIAQGQGLAALIGLPDGPISFMGLNSFLTSVSIDEAAEIVNGIVNSGLIPDDVAVPLEAQPLLERLISLLDQFMSIESSMTQQRDFLLTAENSLERQRASVENVGKLSEELDRALAASDSVRQAGQIATRLAIVALLIYLVQIIANRYRFFQRMSNFYNSRSNVLRILGMQARGRDDLEVLKLSEVIAALNSDSISFDKGREPLLSQIVPIVEAAAKR
jgi:hypothetical protein